MGPTTPSHVVWTYSRSSMSNAVKTVLFLAAIALVLREGACSDDFQDFALPSVPEATFQEQVQERDLQSEALELVEEPWFVREADEASTFAVASQKGKALTKKAKAKKAKKAKAKKAKAKVKKAKKTLKKAAKKVATKVKAAKKKVAAAKKKVAVAKKKAKKAKKKAKKEKVK